MTNTHSHSSHAPEQMAEPDHVDIGSIIRYAVGLAAITGISMLAMYFTHDGGDTSKWRVKGHAQADFWTLSGNAICCA